MPNVRALDLPIVIKQKQKLGSCMLDDCSNAKQSLEGCTGKKQGCRLGESRVHGRLARHIRANGI